MKTRAGRPVAGAAGRQKQLGVHRHAVGGGVDHLLWDNQVVRREIGRDGLRGDLAGHADSELHHGACGTFRVAAKVRDAACHQDRRPF
jgi:hypothetical protein